jgi:diaminopimelate decarboxylase
MTAFAYRHGRLFAEDADLTAIAAEIGTPFYCYSARALVEAYQAYAVAFPDALIAYSVKANGNVAVLKTLADQGAGADVVSGGELKRALAAGIPPARIVFSGVGKTKPEMKLALEAGIHQFNVESEPELVALDAVARDLGKRAPIAFRINPGVDAKTHAKITTGTAEAKFGVPWSRARAAYAQARDMACVEVVGVDVHIGSQITQLEPFKAAFTRVAELVAALRGDGHTIARADLGGGLGVDYGVGEAPPRPADYAAMVTTLTRDLGVSLILEPGRSIAAQAGVLVTSVVYAKQGENREFLILDAGMNDLIRPAMYEAHHAILSVKEAGGPARPYDVVGPVCESADVFARGRMLPTLESGDLVAILSAGAYGAVMASAYNARTPAAEVLVKGEQWSVVRQKLSDDDHIRRDILPPWQRQ